MIFERVNPKFARMVALPMKMEYRAALDELEAWCARHQLAVPDQALPMFSAYIELLLHYQKQTNLTGFDSAESLVRELFCDSLQILRTGPLCGKVLDVGTGAGFPAIPLRILCPDLEMILVEPRIKRYAFLRLVERELGLGNISIHRARIENVEVPGDLRLAMSKAFAPLPQWLEIARTWAQNGADVACLVSQKDWESIDISEHGYTLKRMLVENHRVYAVVGLP